MTNVLDDIIIIEYQFDFSFFYQQDKSYLLPIMMQIVAEREEAEALAKNKLKDLPGRSSSH